MLVTIDDDEGDGDDRDHDDADEYIGNFVDISCKVAKFESFQHSSKLSALPPAFLPKSYHLKNLNLAFSSKKNLALTFSQGVLFPSIFSQSEFFQSVFVKSVSF